MELRFWIDPETDLPHIYDHGVTESEVREVLDRPGVTSKERNNSVVQVGKTSAGRHLKVVYVPDDDAEGAFVVTAYPIKGKALRSYRKAMKKRSK